MCIIGVHSGSGIVLAADRRVNRGYGYSEESRLILVHRGQMALAYAGSVSIMDDFRRRLKASTSFKRALNIYDAFEITREIIVDICRTCTKTGAPSSEDLVFEVICCGLDHLSTGSPCLFRFDIRGFTETIPTFFASGPGSAYAESLLKVLYSRDMSKEGAIALASYTILQTALVDSTVGGNLDIAVVEENKLPEMLKQNRIQEIATKTTGISSMLARLTLDLFRQEPKKADLFLERLGKCPPGKDHWKEYEDLVEEIFSYLFVPPLQRSRSQIRASDGSEIRDIIFPNINDSLFWKHVRAEYKGAYVVVEVKNKLKADKSDVLQLSDYLQDRQLGLFGILISRGMSQSAIDQRRKLYSTEPHKMIVLLDDDDIREAVVKKSNNEDPEGVIRDRIDAYRIQYRF